MNGIKATRLYDTFARKMAKPNQEQSICPHDHTHSSPHMQTVAWLAIARLFVGVGWVVEATIGKFWKLGWFSSGMNPEWIGAEAGSVVSKVALTGIDQGVWPWYAWVLEAFLLPYVGFWSPLIAYLQFAIGLFLIMGLFTRTSASMGLLMLVSILLMGSYRTSPLLIAGHLFILVTHAGRYFSLDSWLFGRSDATLKLESRTWGMMAAVASALALYLIMQVSHLPMPRYQWISLELTVFLGFIIVGIYLTAHTTHSMVTIAAACLRMYVGYKLLWWAWVAPQASLTSLPGLIGAEPLAGVFVKGIASHWAPLADIIRVNFLPWSGFWSLVLGVAQVLTGLMLVLGCFTRIANWGAVFLTLLYTLLGFTRYAPYLMGFGFIALVLGSGASISFVDNFMREPADEKPPIQLTLGPAAFFGVLGMSGFVMAMLLSIVPNGYTSAVGSTVFWTLSIDFCLLSLGSLLPVIADSFSQIGRELETDMGLRAAYAKL